MHRKDNSVKKYPLQYRLGNGTKSLKRKVVSVGPENLDKHQYGRRQP